MSKKVQDRLHLYLLLSSYQNSYRACVSSLRCQGDGSLCSVCSSCSKGGVWLAALETTAHTSSSPILLISKKPTGFYWAMRALMRTATLTPCQINSFASPAVRAEAQAEDGRHPASRSLGSGSRA